MSLVLNTNINSLVAQNALTSSGTQLASALEQLSTGLRINTAADDAAGYAIVNGMTSQINGLNQAAQNANDGVSLAQTGSGALSEIVNDLQSMRDLAVESLNATNSAADREDLDAQFQQLKADINSVASQTDFNGVNLLDGTFQGATFQVGANAGQSITVSSIASAAASNLGQLYTAAATDPANYTSNGNSTTAATDPGVAVANGDTGTFTITIGGTAYTTSQVTLTGDQATDLKTIAAAINEATGSSDVVATVDSTGEGINLSSTDPQIISASYSAGTGTETLATFGLLATNSLGDGYTANGTGVTSANYTTAIGAGAASTSYTAAGTAVSSGDYTADTTSYTAAGADVTGTAWTALDIPTTGTADTASFTVTVGGTQYSTASPVSLTGTQATDLANVAAALNTALASSGVTATVDSAKEAIDLNSATSQTVTVAATFAGGGTDGAAKGTETVASFGFSGTAGSTSITASVNTDQAAISVTIGGTKYTAAAVTLTGTQATDLKNIVAAINAVTTAHGVTASVDSNGSIDLNSDTSQTVTVGAAFTGNGPSGAAQAAETLGTFGLSSSTAITTSVAEGDTATFTVAIGGDDYETTAVTLTGDQSKDLKAIAAAINDVTAAHGVTASVDSNGSIDLSSPTSQTVTVTGAFAGDGTAGAAEGTETAATFGFAGTAGSTPITTAVTAGASTTLSNADVLTVDDSNLVLIQVDQALQQLATTGADLGAYQNRFQAAVTGLQTDSTNLSSARSQIQDTDYAQATSQLTQAQILQQAGTAMVAQANEIPQNVLTLLEKLT